jgi:hypothetical protein
MKKRFLIMATLVVGLGLTACSVDTSGLEDAANDLEEQIEGIEESADSLNKEIEETANSGASLTYQCPVDCDNGPVYDEPGPCVKCGEEMVIL